MNLRDVSPLSEKTAQALLDQILPSSRLVLIELASGSYSNYTHIVTASDTKGSEFRIVVRRYQVFGHYDRGEKARREFTVLQLACQNDVPVPQPLYLDETGDLLGIPGIVTDYVSGVQVHSPVDSISWAWELANTLAKIHMVSCDQSTRSILLDANAEASWFLHSGEVPEFMHAHPDGERVWQAAHDGFPQLKPVESVLVHVDYWSGNVLWDGDNISAVVDWEEAAYGDPAIDVAYCRMDMILLGLHQAADEFLQVYEAAVGRPLANLGFWELAAAARPMYNAGGWVDQSPNRERFAQFITAAMQRQRAIIGCD